jgi:hypothetical protein
MHDLGYPSLQNNGSPHQVREHIFYEKRLDLKNFYELIDFVDSSLGDAYARPRDDSIITSGKLILADQVLVNARADSPTSKARAGKPASAGFVVTN